MNPELTGIMHDIMHLNCPRCGLGFVSLDKQHPKNGPDGKTFFSEGTRSVEALCSCGGRWIIGHQLLPGESRDIFE